MLTDKSSDASVWISVDLVSSTWWQMQPCCTTSWINKIDKDNTHIMLWIFFFTGMCRSLQNASEADVIKISWTRKVSTEHFGRISGCAQAQPEPRPCKWLSVLLRPWHGHLPFRPSPQQPFRPTHYAYIIKQSHKNKEINTKSFSNLLLWLAARSLRTSKSSQYCHLH